MKSIAVVGASGRTGSLIVERAHEYDFCVDQAVVSPQSNQLGRLAKAGEENFGKTVNYTVLREELTPPSLLIEFSLPEVTEQSLHYCLKHKIPILIATTGHSQSTTRLIQEASSVIPILHTANTSRAVFALNELAVMAARLLGPRYDIEIAEIHHRHKKDAPSGTALHVARSIALASSLRVTQSRCGPQALRGEGELGVASLRGGGVAGEHTVYFLGESERIEITQRAQDRGVFAHGALSLATILMKKAPGYYTADDLYREEYCTR